MSQPDLVLASNSPRRQELLALTGWNFHTHPVEVDENQLPGEAAGSYVLRLAEFKARTCAASTGVGCIILAADTAVVDGKMILGKPKNKVEALKMLQQLRGHTHQVFTGIAVMNTLAGNLFKDLCITDVQMRIYTDDEIDDYVASGDPLDKAGAYAIQHPRFHPVDRLSGCCASVMGLPLCHLARTFRHLDLTPFTDIASQCQSSLNYCCPISAAVLRGEQVG
jgi:septum formation protein